MPKEPNRETANSKTRKLAIKEDMKIIKIESIISVISIRKS